MIWFNLQHKLSGKTHCSQTNKFLHLKLVGFNFKVPQVQSAYQSSFDFYLPYDFSSRFSAPQTWWIWFVLPFGTQILSNCHPLPSKQPAHQTTFPDCTFTKTPPHPESWVPNIVSHPPLSAPPITRLIMPYNRKLPSFTAWAWPS